MGERGISGSIPCSSAYSVDSACSNQSNYFCYYDCKIKRHSFKKFECIKHNWKLRHAWLMHSDTRRSKRIECPMSLPYFMQFSSIKMQMFCKVPLNIHSVSWILNLINVKFNYLSSTFIIANLPAPQPVFAPADSWKFPMNYNQNVT